MDELRCTICGLPLICGTTCLTCGIGLEDVEVSYIVDSSGLVVMWWTSEEIQMTASNKIPAKDFAELIRAQRSRR